ncbi:phospholipase [Proteiniphilum sp.]|uniref:phospholipase n=1 Tax=Proteiniphilum sp. TaxID=1926877 RepID=UPI002B21F087|nr:phospholipase [Proteiniphilum sp.]MEA4916291.1 phospholipase [Proteiniphilum sp.]
MQSLLLFIGIILFFIVALTISNYHQRRKGNIKEREATPSPLDLGNGGCCGAHEICERDSLIAAFAEKPEYFDDEELDQYAHRDSGTYGTHEVDEFREVFYSVLDEEKPRWIRSLQMRNISLPNQLKDEVLMFINELKKQKMHV